MSHFENGIFGFNVHDWSMKFLDLPPLMPYRGLPIMSVALDLVLTFAGEKKSGQCPGQRSNEVLAISWLPSSQ